MSLIATEALTRHYGRRRGIENIQLAVPEGARYGFLGPNGAGKSTTIRVLLGFLRPTAGSARIFGFDCWRQSRRIKADIGYLPGDLRLPGWLTGASALRLVGRVRGRDLLDEGRKLAEKFDLDPDVKVRRMSRGMRQKLGLILALAHRPRLLVLDEPTSGLDPLMQAQLHQHLRQMAADGHTVFFSSHSLGEVEQLCDRVAIVRAGALVADESLDELRAHAGHQVTIRWPDAAAAAGPPPDFMVLEERDGRTWTGMLQGPVDRLIDWLAGRAVDDLSIGRPDLESLFRRYYEPDRMDP